jgi:hypothetical protein
VVNWEDSRLAGDASAHWIVVAERVAAKRQLIQRNSNRVPSLCSETSLAGVGTWQGCVSNLGRTGASAGLVDYE